MWIFLIMMAMLTQIVRAEGPTYASPETKIIIESMIKAHGGYQSWVSAPSIVFHTYFEVNFGSNNWVPYREELTVHPQTRHVYGKLPNADGTFGQIGFDGKNAWASGNLQGMAKYAPARFTAWRDFYLFNIVWLTQDNGIRLSEPSRARLGVTSDTKEYIKITMTFDDHVGDTPKDYYILFIDPETYRLKASQYVMTYASMMQDGAKSSPPSIFIWEKTSTINGLVFPSAYSVYWKDGSMAVRQGKISNWNITSPFDAAQVEPRKDAIKDESKPR